jgi:hypothetical protein
MGSINSYKQYRLYFGFDLNKGTPSTGIVYGALTHDTKRDSSKVSSDMLSIRLEILLAVSPLVRHQIIKV